MPPLPSAFAGSLKWLWRHLTGIECQPDTQPPPTWSGPARGYRFEALTVASGDGTRRWRVELGIPHAAPPAAGFPSFWMLDGPRARAELDEALLQALADHPQPQVLVFFGHDHDDAETLPSLRARDYTFRAGRYPFLQPPGAAPDHPVGGGADHLLEVLERQLWPRLAARAPLDPARRTLWGHSLGGLLVLHALLSRPAAFRTYVAASPSVWWCGGAVMDEPVTRFEAHNAGRRAHLVVCLGGNEREGRIAPARPGDAAAAGLRQAIAGAPPDAAFTLAARLAGVPGLEVCWREFPGLDHAPMFRASLLHALRHLSKIPGRALVPLRVRA